MNANNDQKTILKQAEVEFGLVDSRSESVQAEEATKNSPLIQMRLAEELMSSIREEKQLSVIELGTDVYNLQDRLEWDVKTTFLRTLIEKEILVSAMTDFVDGIMVSRIGIGLNASFKLQTILNSLALEVEKSGIYKLMPDTLKYSTAGAYLESDGRRVNFRATDNSHYFLDYMFNHVERNILVEVDELYEIVFCKEMSFLNKSEKNNERNKQAKDLRNVMDSINDRIKKEFKTCDRLFSAQGGYRRDF